MKKIIIGIVLLFLLGSGIFYFTKYAHNAVEPDHSNYSVVVTQPKSDNITLNQPTKISYTIRSDRGEIIKDFAIAHEKIMHFILIRKDLTQFQHLHPDFDKATGEFTVDVVFTEEGPYRFFADFTPQKNNPEKIPVTAFSDLNVGGVSSLQHDPLSPDTAHIKMVPPDYKVAYAVPHDIKAREPFQYSLTVSKNNQSMVLEPYLGALGHSVIIRSRTLEYIHTHAGEQGSGGHAGHEGHDGDISKSANQIDFTTTLPEPGIYKVFTQFQHDGEVKKTEYIIEAK